MGRWHDEPVGPHPISMYQIQFATDMFPTLVPVVMMNRLGLTVLLHPHPGAPATTIRSTPPGWARCCL